MSPQIVHFQIFLFLILNLESHDFRIINGAEFLIFIFIPWLIVDIRRVNIAFLFNVFSSCHNSGFLLPRCVVLIENYLFNILHINLGSSRSLFLAWFSYGGCTLVFTFDSYLYICFFAQSVSSVSIFEILFIIFRFEKLLQILSLINWWRQVCERVTQVKWIASVMENEFSHKVRKHFIFIIIGPFLYFHYVIYVDFQG